MNNLITASSIYRLQSLNIMISKGSSDCSKFIDSIFVSLENQNLNLITDPETNI